MVLADGANNTISTCSYYEHTVIRQRALSRTVHCVTLPTANNCIVVAPDTGIYKLDPYSLAVIGRHCADKAVRALSYASNGLVVAMGVEASIVLCSPAYDVIDEAAVHNGNVNVLSFSPSSHMLVSSSVDRVTVVWSPSPLSALKIIQHVSNIHTSAFLSDHALAVTDGKILTTWMVASFKSSTPQNLNQGAITSISLAPDGTTFAIGTMDGVIAVFDVSTFVSVRLIREPQPISIGRLLSSSDMMYCGPSTQVAARTYRWGYRGKVEEVS